MENQSGKLWRLRLFGGPILEAAEGGSAIGFRSAKVVALLAYLGLHHGKACSREALTEALWPGEPDSPARANRFRVTLASLRRQLEPEGFPYGSVLDPSVNGCLRLSTETVWCDFTEFQAALEREDRAAAAKLAVGRLLPAIYEDWASSDQIRVELLQDELAHLRPAVEPEEAPQPAGSVVGHRLPAYLSKFIQREAELKVLGECLSETRLVTISGPGGVGKTRLSVEGLRGSQIRSIFVPLADLGDGHSLLEALVRHLHIGSQTTAEPFQQLLEFLPRQGPLRLVLDNAEHLIDEVRDLCAVLLDASPELHILVSSRQRLELEGERVVGLEPFGAAAAQSLFLDRLTQSRPDFAPNASHRALVEQICARLEGLPLAIELAAAQISIHSLAEILRNLDNALVDLRSRRRSLSARHRSLRAALESSFTGLDADLLRFLGQLTSFWGGWTEADAVAVTGDDQAMEKLEELTVRSLVRAEIQASPVRFTCLEVVRQLAQEKLTPDEAQEADARHSAHFLHLASQVDENDLSTLAPLDGEELNLLAAFRRAQPSQPGFLRASSGAILNAFIRGNHRSGLEWIREHRKYLTLSEDAEERREWYKSSLLILVDLGLFAEAEPIIDQLELDSKEFGDELGLAEVLIARGLMSARAGDLGRAIQLHREALAKATGLGDRSTLESALAHLSGTLHEVARLENPEGWDVAACLEESVRLSETLIKRVSPESRRHPLAYLLAGVAEFYRGRWDASGERLASAIVSAERLGITTVTMYASFFEAEIARKLGRQEEADLMHARFQSLRAQTGVSLGQGTWS